MEWKSRLIDSPVTRSVPDELVLPGAEQAQGVAAFEAMGVLGEVALLRDRVEPGEEREARVGGEGHDVALALDGPELEREGREQRLGCGNGLGAWQRGGGRELRDREPDQVRHEEEEAAAGGDELAGREREAAHVGDRLDGRTEVFGALLVEAPGSGAKPSSRRMSRAAAGVTLQPALGEGVADVLHRVVLLA